MIANSNLSETLPEAWHSSPVPLNHPSDDVFGAVRLMEADVIADENRYRHDPAKLAAALIRLYDSRQNTPGGANGRPADQPTALATTH